MKTKTQEKYDNLNYVDKLILKKGVYGTIDFALQEQAEELKQFYQSPQKCPEGTLERTNEDKTPSSHLDTAVGIREEDRGSICKNEKEHKKFYDFFGSVDCDICLNKFKAQAGGK